MMMLPLVQDKKKREGKEEKTEGRKEGRVGGREERRSWNMEHLGENATFLSTLRS